MKSVTDNIKDITPHVPKSEKFDLHQSTGMADRKSDKKSEKAHLYSKPKMTHQIEDPKPALKVAPIPREQPETHSFIPTKPRADMTR